MGDGERMNPVVAAEFGGGNDADAEAGGNRLLDRLAVGDLERNRGRDARRAAGRLEGAPGDRVRLAGDERLALQVLERDRRPLAAGPGMGPVDEGENRLFAAGQEDCLPMR